MRRALGAGLLAGVVAGLAGHYLGPTLWGALVFVLVVIPTVAAVQGRGARVVAIVVMLLVGSLTVVAFGGRRLGREERNDPRLHEAVANRDLKAIRSYLRWGADVDSRAEQDWTPLQVAADLGYEDVAELLLAKGADVNACNADYMVPLSCAAAHGDVAMAKLLLGHGADVNGTLQAGGDTGTGPLEESRATDPAYHPTTPLWEAARAGHADVARLLLAEGADANVPRGQDLSVPLHAAAGEGHLGVVRLLVAQGADVGVQDAGGETPLDWAAGAGRNEVVDFLKQQGAAK